MIETAPLSAVAIANKGASAELLCASVIMQGLLASGHYTELAPNEDGGVEPKIRTWDRGKDFKECGYDSRFGKFIIEDTIDLLEELKKHLK